MSHKLRFWLAVALSIPSHLLFFVEGLLWIGYGALRSGLLSVLGIAMMACGITILSYRRSR